MSLNEIIAKKHPNSVMLTKVYFRDAVNPMHLLVTLIHLSNDWIEVEGHILIGTLNILLDMETLPVNGVRCARQPYRSAHAETICLTL